jgi:hypothetical protein
MSVKIELSSDSWSLPATEKLSGAPDAVADGHVQHARVEAGAVDAGARDRAGGGVLDGDGAARG